MIKLNSHKNIIEVLFMAVKIAVLNIVSKELNGNQQRVPFEPYGAFGEDNLDTVYYDPDTNRVTIHLSGAHSGLDLREPGNFNYSLLPDTAEMESHVHYEGGNTLKDKWISFTPLQGKNNYSFANYMVFLFEPLPPTPPTWLTMKWVGVDFSFEGK